MFDQLVEIFCDFDDFYRSIKTQWESIQITDGPAPIVSKAPDAGLINNEIMTILVLFLDEAALNGRNIAKIIICHITKFSSL